MQKNPLADNRGCGVQPTEMTDVEKLRGVLATLDNVRVRVCVASENRHPSSAQQAKAVQSAPAPEPGLASLVGLIQANVADIEQGVNRLFESIGI